MATWESPCISCNTLSQLFVAKVSIRFSCKDKNLFWVPSMKSMRVEATRLELILPVRVILTHCRSKF